MIAKVFLEMNMSTLNAVNFFKTNGGMVTESELKDCRNAARDIKRYLASIIYFKMFGNEMNYEPLETFAAKYIGAESAPAPEENLKKLPDAQKDILIAIDNYRRKLCNPQEETSDEFVKRLEEVMYYSEQTPENTLSGGEVPGTEYANTLLLGMIRELSDQFFPDYSKRKVVIEMSKRRFLLSNKAPEGNTPFELIKSLTEYYAPFNPTFTVRLNNK